MEYRFNFSPRFFKNKRALLSYTSTPPLALPAEILKCLDSSYLHKNVSSTRWLWMACFRAALPFINRSVGVSIVTAACASGATLAAMKLLDPAKTTSQSVPLLYALGYFAASVMVQITALLNNRLRNWANHVIQALLINLISQKLLRMSSRAEVRQTTGNLKVLITSDTHHVGNFVDNFVRNFIPSMVMLALVLPWVVHLSGQGGLVGVLIMVAFLPIAVGLNQIGITLQNKGQTALDSLASVLGEWVKNVRLVRTLSWGDSFEKDIVTRLRRYMSYCTYQHLMMCFIFGLSVSWWMFAVAGLFMMAKHSSQSLDVTAVFGSIWLINFLAGYFIHLPHTLRLYGLALPSVKRIAALLREEEQQDLFVHTLHEEKLTSEIPTHVHFQKVSFKYESQKGEKETINALTLTLPLNQKTAIVGEVGCGKTTFLKLLCGEYPPTQGEILVEFADGSRHNLWKRNCYETFRKNLAWVPQEPFVSSDPLSANISLISGAEELALVEAAYWAEMEADIGLFPKGIHEEIGEGGVNLSGGQRQRLNIARAYFSDRIYLVLDDALSAVDSNTETALMKRLDARGTESGKGFVLVTHRTAELMRVHEVLVMKDGIFIERGSPQNLSQDERTEFSRVLRAYQTEVNNA